MAVNPLPADDDEIDGHGADRTESVEEILRRRPAVVLQMENCIHDGIAA